MSTSDAGDNKNTDTASQTGQIGSFLETPKPGELNRQYALTGHGIRFLVTDDHWMVQCFPMGNGTSCRIRAVNTAPAG